MLSKRSYVRLFSMAVLLTGSYAGLWADGDATHLDCYSTPTPKHLIACISGQVRPDNAQHDLCNDLCVGPEEPDGCNWSGTSCIAHWAYTGSPPNGPGCDGTNNWMLYCACDIPNPE